MKPSKFGVFLARSARYGKTFQVNNATHLALITRADTSPELGHYEVGTTTWKYVFEGKACSKSIPLTCLLKDGRTCYWDVGSQWSSRKAAFAQEVARQQAALAGADYLLFEREILGSTYEERKNRQTTQSYLYQAREFETYELETAILLDLIREPRTLHVLADRNGKGLIPNTVAVLRLWLNSRVEVPLQSQLLQPSWQIRRLDGHA